MKFYLLLLTFAFYTHLHSLDERNNESEKSPQPKETLSFGPTPSTAPLLSLDPQYPLQMTQANLRLLIHDPQRIEEEKQSIRKEIERHTFPWIAVIVLLGCGGIGWTAFLTKDYWPKKKKKFQPDPPLEQEIYAAFAGLEMSRTLEKGEVKGYYSQLGSIVLLALSRILPGTGKELTTEELTQYIKNSSNLTDHQKDSLRSSLREIDHVKYAGKTSSKNAINDFHQELKNLLINIVSLEGQKSKKN